MGSLGLEYLTKQNWDSQDIDIHVKGDSRGWEPLDEERISEWDVICEVMMTLDYILIDLHEHAFLYHEYRVEFGVVDTLPRFANINPNQLELICLNGVQFYLPNHQQFLKTYRSSAQDSYQGDQNNHKDQRKIVYLQRSVSQHD